MKPSSYSRLVTTAAVAASAVAGTLILAKLLAWFYTGSASMLASLTDSLLDISASLINLMAIRYALVPPDQDHKFGHGKAESLAGLAQSAFISGSAIFLIINGVSRLLNAQEVTHAELGLWVMLFSMVLTIGLVLFQGYVIRRTGSVAIRADQLHYRSDILLNFGVLLAIALAWYGWHWADGAFAVLIGGYILRGALKIGYDSVQMLLDRQLPEEEQKRIIDTCLAVEGVRGLHELRTRQSGPTRFIQLHLELDDQLPLVRAHRIADRAERELRTLFPDTDVIIHMDPISVVPREAHSQDMSEHQFIENKV
ncbi:divalent metal cation transporter FieF [Zobellella denitrificans]|jgi:ferrous-iron efflux pump FieF|uniref:Cation-efflux pump FieF n=1 Tax=Zobellella denitrificans TaxID=347534 RepID=A0A231N1N9_9GAMM|nr:cation diffusion facilitator family transporter [Zobellella denitrificans]ATG72585.1 ferrous iron transporter [Zobellella denitrificans]OXS16239.1 divalent metal cation transporter FieF [Zobellella denitrificans]